MKNKTRKKNWKEIFMTIKTGIDYFSIIGVIYILLYQIKSLRKICKALSIYVLDWYVAWSGNTTISLSDILEKYFRVEVFFKVSICLSIILMLVFSFIRFINDKKLAWKATIEDGKSRFEESLFRYLYEEGTPRCFFVTGKWGSGKTYEVNQFFNKYYKLSNKKIYKVSCFGLSTRKELLEEMKNIIEQQDHTLYTKTIDILTFIPVIGEALGKLLKKSYSYDSIKKGSIFIFDDFERITSRAIHMEYAGTLYQKSPFFLNGSRGSGASREFEDIKREFGAVQKAFSQMSDLASKQIAREDYDKYIAIIGMINELIETYGMKVIIICNSEILGERFVHDVLRSKLNCIEYKKTVSTEVKKSLMNEVLKTKILDDRDKQSRISNYLTAVREKLEEVVVGSIFMDLRLYSGVLEAFMYTANMFQTTQLTKEFLSSLLNSIMVSHLAYYNNSFSHLSQFRNGANIDIMVTLFGGDRFDLITIDGDIDETKWVDVEISAQWILNLSHLSWQEIDEKYNQWKNYNYLELEKKMLKNYELLQPKDDYQWYHILYYQKRWDKEWQSLQLYLANLKGYDYKNINVVNEMLRETNDAFNSNVFWKFEEQFFNMLAQEKAVGEILPETDMQLRYIDYLKTH